MPPELKDARRLNKTEFERIANKYVWATDEELGAALRDPATPAIERLLVNILCHGISDGDQARAEWFCMRLLGKVTEKLEVKQPTPFVITRHSGEQVVLGAKLEDEAS